MFDIYNPVKVIDENGKLIKEGIIVRLTTHGAHIYQPKCEYPFSDSIEWAEWFPFNSEKVKILPRLKRQKRV